MKIIDKYMLREYLVPFAYCLSAFCVLYVILDLFDRFPDFLEAKVPIQGILLYYFYYLFAVNGFVPFVVVVLPIALLLSALYTLTMFARHNELTAMCAGGVSIRRLMVPFVLVGFCASLSAAVIQETLGPAATGWIADYRKRVLDRSESSADIVRDYLYHSGTAHRHWQIGKLNKRNPVRLFGVKVSQERDDGTLAIEIMAKRAAFLDGRWWFFGVQRREYNEAGDPVGPLTSPVEAPEEMPDLAETPTDFLNELVQTDFLSSWQMFSYLRAHPTMTGAGRARREVDIFARLAMPWSCIVMILLSLPATAGGVRRPALMSVGFGLAALFGFYFFVHTGMILGKREVIWPWLAGWLPNIVFLGIGGVLTWRLR